MIEFTMDKNSSVSSTSPSVDKPSADSLSEFERYRRMQMEQFEDDIADGRCYPEMPEGQFVRGK